MSRNAYDQHLDEFGAALRAASSVDLATADASTPSAPAAAPSRSTWSRRLRRPLVAFPGGFLVIAAIAAAVIVIPGGRAALDPVAQAQAALGGPSGAILDYSVQFSGGVVPKDPAKALSAADRARKAADERCSGGPSELWRTTTGPVRWRVHWSYDPCGFESNGAHGFEGPMETSYADGVLKTYDAVGKWLQVKSELDPQEHVPPRLFDDGVIERTDTFDPGVFIRQLLDERHLKDAGEIVVDGRRLRRFTATLPPPAAGAHVVPQSMTTLEYRVDATTFAPVSLSRTFPQYVVVRGKDLLHLRKQLRTLRYTLTFLVYRHLPLTPENEKLLSVQPTAGTQVVTTTSAAASAAAHHPTPAQRAQIAKAFAAARKLQARGPHVAAESVSPPVLPGAAHAEPVTTTP